jgi:hypothetical protein
MNNQPNPAQPTTPEPGPTTSPDAGGRSGPNHPEAGDTRRSDQNNQHKGGADPTGGPGGTGGSVL